MMADVEAIIEEQAQWNQLEESNYQCEDTLCETKPEESTKDSTRILPKPPPPPPVPPDAKFIKVDNSQFVKALWNMKTHQKRSSWTDDSWKQASTPSSSS